MLQVFAIKVKNQTEPAWIAANWESWITAQALLIEDIPCEVVNVQYPFVVMLRCSEIREPFTPPQFKSNTPQTTVVVVHLGDGVYMPITCSSWEHICDWEPHVRVRAEVLNIVTNDVRPMLIPRSQILEPNFERLPESIQQATVRYATESFSRPLPDGVIWMTITASREKLNVLTNLANRARRLEFLNAVRDYVESNTPRDDQGFNYDAQA